ncbi:ATP-grasp domain-containing protein [Arhodomonas aquaeolei]|uniref:ATP-grasp domain-containing protein n=1 Tax=Arhodomonas aquaeolei TaxID=2369 RepID=UPI000A030B75|nr:ATP-grasp domain-containing protein [Arhodomonas aquaeolei]
MSKVLLLDTNFSSTPIYNYLVDRGHEVYVMGNNPDDALAKNVEHYIRQDYSQIEVTRSLIRDIGIEHVVPGCNDQSYRVCAALNEDEGHPGIDDPETTETLTNKAIFRDFAAATGLPSPKVIEKKDGLLEPVMVKPTDAYSGRGITILRDGDESQLLEAKELAKKFSPSNSYLIEEYIEGQLHSHSAFLRAQEIAHDTVVEEHGSANPFVVDTSRVSPEFPPSSLDEIREVVTRIAGHLKLKDGLIHTQFILSDGGIWIVEVTRRCPGDLYSVLVESSTGLNYVENYVRPFLGLPYRFEANPGEPSNVMRHTVSSTEPLVFNALQFNVPFQAERFVPLAEAGDKVAPSPFGRMGILFAKTSESNELDHLFSLTLDRKLYRFND